MASFHGFTEWTVASRVCSPIGSGVCSVCSAPCLLRDVQHFHDGCRSRGLWQAIWCTNLSEEVRQIVPVRSVLHTYWAYWYNGEANIVD